MPRSRIASSDWRAQQRVEHRRVVGRADAVAVQPGVDLHRDGRGTAGAFGRVEHFGELTHRRHRDLDVGAQRGREVGAGRVQPRQHRRGDAVARAARAPRRWWPRPSSVAPAASAARDTGVAPCP